MISAMVGLSLALSLASLAQASPAPATPPRPDDPYCVVRGVLVDLVAAPAAGIELTLTATPRPRRGSLPASAPTPGIPLLTTRTGVDGAFELRFERPDDFELALVVTDVMWQDFAWELRGIAPGRPLHLGATTLARACDAVVHVRDEDGRLLVEGWTVELVATPEVGDAWRRRAPPQAISLRDGVARFVRAPATQCLVRISGPDGATVMFVRRFAPGLDHDVEVVWSGPRARPDANRVNTPSDAAPLGRGTEVDAEVLLRSSLQVADAARSGVEPSKTEVQVWVRAPETLAADALRLTLDHHLHVPLAPAPERPPAHGLRWLRGSFITQPGPGALVLGVRRADSRQVHELRRSFETRLDPSTSVELDTTDLLGVSVTLETGLPGEAAAGITELGVERTTPGPDGSHERRLVRNLAAQAARGLPLRPRVVLLPGEYRVVAAGPGWSYTGTVTARVAAGDPAPTLPLSVPRDALRLR
jgi:hypothetical protein